MNGIALQESFWSYRNAFRERLGGEGCDRAAEPRGEYECRGGPLPLDERLVQTIWAQQLLGGGEMRLADGRRVRVLDPGRWNGAAGPDFQGARLMLDADPVFGDVEIHIRAGDWLNHGHQRDLDYNGVVLHAVLKIDDGRTGDPLHNGRTIPRLELEPYLFPDLETIRRSLTADDFQYAQPVDFGRCHRLMTELDSQVIVDFLNRAGEERLFAKVRRLEDQAEQVNLEQVFYQALMMALGSGPGKTLYYLLAKRTPAAELLDFAGELPSAERSLGLEALLLAVAGLLPAAAELEAAAPDVRARAADLAELWRRFEPYWRDRQIPPTRRWYQGIRPVNFPVRRLAGVAILLSRASERRRSPLNELLARVRAGRATLENVAPTRRLHPLLKELVAWFVVPGEGHFWGTHYSFSARPAARPMMLIGEATALGLLFNALLPVMLLAARREGDDELARATVRLFSLMPPLQPNHITEFMTRRLFGDDPRAAGLVNTEQRRQALFQIFFHCCNGEENHCDDCHYFTA